MASEGGEAGSLLPAAVLRNSLCADAKLSKRAASLLRRECDALAARLLVRAFAERARGGPLESADIWEALLGDAANSWLTDRLGLWVSPGVDDAAPALIADVPLPLPPDGLTPDSHLLPRLLWLRASQAGGLPMHDSLLCDEEDASERDLKRARVGTAETVMHACLLQGGAV